MSLLLKTCNVKWCAIYFWKFPLKFLNYDWLIWIAKNKRVDELCYNKWYASFIEKYLLKMFSGSTFLLAKSHMLHLVQYYSFMSQVLLVLVLLNQGTWLLCPLPCCARLLAWFHFSSSCIVWFTCTVLRPNHLPELCQLSVPALIVMASDQTRLSPGASGSFLSSTGSGLTHLLPSHHQLAIQILY